jgi:hypothetical protein
MSNSHSLLHVSGHAKASASIHYPGAAEARFRVGHR